MSGPALKQLSAHQAIHNAAHEETMVTLASLRRLVEEGKQTAASQAAEVFVDIYETKILRHAEAEETGFYPDMEAEHPGTRPLVDELRREHEAMGVLLGTIRKRLAEGFPGHETAALMTALVACNAAHSRHEEEALIAPLERKSAQNASDTRG